MNIGKKKGGEKQQGVVGGRSPLRYVCVLDFEATCVESSDEEVNEIIEFPGVLYKLLEDEEGEGEEKKERLRMVKLSEFESFVRPRDNEVGEYCTKLTSITPEMVLGAPSFPEVFCRYKEWLRGEEEKEGVVFDEWNFVFATCGNWDLKWMLPRDVRRWGLELEVSSIWRRWLNVKYEVEGFYHVKAGGMAGILSYLQIELVGKHHRGIDDCRNIGAILERLFADGYVVKKKHIQVVKLYS